MDPIAYIVDDDDDVRDSLECMFKVYKVPYKPFSSAANFLEDYDSSWLGCLVVDQNMPEMQGTELLEKINNLNTKLNAIVITGSADDETLSKLSQEAAEQGAIAVVQKSHKVDILISWVKFLLEYQGQVSASTKDVSESEEFLAKCLNTPKISL